MRQTTSDEFFKRLRAEKRDVHPRIVSDRYPYVSDWVFQHATGRPLFGRSVGKPDGTSDYFLPA